MPTEERPETDENSTDTVRATDRRSFLGAVGASAIPIGIGSASATTGRHAPSQKGTVAPSISTAERHGEDDGDPVYELQGRGFGSKDQGPAVLYDFVSEAYENGNLNPFHGESLKDGQAMHTTQNEPRRIYDTASGPEPLGSQDKNPARYVTDTPNGSQQSHRHDGLDAHYRMRNGAYVGLPMAYGGTHGGSDPLRYERPEDKNQLYLAWWMRPDFNPLKHEIFDFESIEGDPDFGDSKYERGERFVVPGGGPGDSDVDGWLLGVRDGTTDVENPNDDGWIELVWDTQSNFNLLEGKTLICQDSGARLEFPDDIRIKNFAGSAKLMRIWSDFSRNFSVTWQPNGFSVGDVRRNYWGKDVEGEPDARQWNLLELVADLDAGWAEARVNFEARGRIEWEPPTGGVAPENSPTMQLVGMHTADYGFNTFRLGEIYQDSSIQRVVVADAETLAEATHYELQRPLEWTDDRVRFALTEGQLSSDEQLYAFVFDDQGQVTEQGQPLTASTEPEGTTIVADRAPDGSRLTSRPDGPVYQTADGTVHLFTWDEPGSGARAVLYDEDEATDWGDGPDTHIYDTMERPGAAAGDVPSRVATQGKWDDYSGAPELHPDGHSGEFAARVQNQNTLYKFQKSFPEATEVFLSYCVKIPEGKAMPGTEQPGEFPERSVWKMSWLYNEDVWAADDDVDIVLPTWNAGGVSLGGNNLDVEVSIQDSKQPDWWLFGEWMRFSFWLECGPDPATDPGRVRWQVVSEGEQTQVVADGQDVIMEDGQPPYAWKQLTIPGWSQNKNVSGDNVEVLYDDIYFSTGQEANARLELGDDPSYDDSSRLQLCQVESWSPNRVAATLRTGTLQSVRGSVVHLTTADERQAVSMEVS